MYLANSDNKQPLDQHLAGVAKLSMYAARHLGLPEKIVELCGVAGMLHDIGKVHPDFQEYLVNEDFQSSSEEFVRHNELSWAFCNDFFKHPGNNREKKQNVSFLQAVFWHHGTTRFDKDIKELTSTKILQIVGEDVIKRIRIFVNNLSEISPVPLSNYIDQEAGDDAQNVPLLFQSTTNVHGNAINLAIRSCLIFADHHVSKLSTDQLQELLKDNADLSVFFPDRKLQASFNEPPPNYDTKRLDNQKEIISKCGRVSVVKAPAGFGKTLVGLMWSVQQGGQIYWVVPRNAVAESVFRNIKEEIEAFKLDLSVEVFLTGERKDSYGKVDKKPCTSDIVITNIDNLLSPIVSDKNVGRLFAVNVATIVFDEYHEFVNEEAMFGTFVSYMGLRQLLAQNTKTLLLSATPSIIHTLWESQDSKSTILPCDDQHYPAQHTKVYNITTSDDHFDHDENDKDSLMVMYNSVRNVQENFSLGGFDHITHSKFTDKHRKEKLENVFDVFGKNGSGKGKIISAPVLQASADISVKQLFRVSESPEADLQTIGRVNRWGREDQADVHFSDVSNKSESSAINVRYKKNLNRLWFDVLAEQTDGKPFTLDQLYKLYNKFNTEHRADVRLYLEERLEESLDRLSKHYYPKVHGEKTERKISGKNLRRLYPSHFVAAKLVGSHDWCNFSFQLTGLELKKYRREGVFAFAAEKQYKLYKKLQAAGFDTTPVLEYMKPPRREVVSKGKKTKVKSTIRRLTEEEILRFSHDADCPIPILDLRYDPMLGLIM